MRTTDAVVVWLLVTAAAAQVQAQEPTTNAPAVQALVAAGEFGGAAFQLRVGTWSTTELESIATTIETTLRPLPLDVAGARRRHAYSLLRCFDPATFLIHDWPRAEFRPRLRDIDRLRTTLGRAILRTSLEQLRAQESAPLAERLALTSHAVSVPNLPVSLALRVIRIARRSGDFRRAEILATRVLANPDISATQRKSATLSHCHAVLRRAKFVEAEQLIRDAIAAYPKQADLVRWLAMCQGGWVELARDGSLIEVAGLGRFAAAYSTLRARYRRLARPLERRGIVAARFEWECYAFAVRAARAGDRRFWRFARALYARDHELASLGPAGEDLATLFRAYPW